MARPTTEMSPIERYMLQNGERLFGAERLLKQPTVVLEQGDQFWPTVINSPNQTAYLTAIKNGHIIPINADVLGEIAVHHTYLHGCIYKSGKAAMIPTIVYLAGRPGALQGTYIPPMIGGIYVKKEDYKGGESTSHNGRGISVIQVTAKNMAAELPKDKFEFLQPFILPPPPYYVTDVRTYIVGGEPVAGYVTKAQRPLTGANIAGDVLPNGYQYPTAQYPGKHEELVGAQRDLVFGQAKEVAEILMREVERSNRPFSPRSPFGFGSIDFLIDANGIPLVVDFDLSPVVSPFGTVHEDLAGATASYLAGLATADSLQREILLVGNPENTFLQSIGADLRVGMPHLKARFQEPLYFTALREMKAL